MAEILHKLACMNLGYGIFEVNTTYLPFTGVQGTESFKILYHPMTIGPGSRGITRRESIMIMIVIIHQPNQILTMITLHLGDRMIEAEDRVATVASEEVAVVKDGITRTLEMITHRGIGKIVTKREGQIIGMRIISVMGIILVLIRIDLIIVILYRTTGIELAMIIIEIEMITTEIEMIIIEIEMIIIEVGVILEVVEVQGKGTFRTEVIIIERIGEITLGEIKKIGIIIE